MPPPAELDANQEAQEAKNIKDKLDSGDAAGLKETINRLYSEHGGKELNEVLAKLKSDQGKVGVSVDVTEHDGKLPDITISGTDTKTNHKHEFKFDAAKDGAGVKDTRNADGSGAAEVRTATGNEYKIKYDTSGKATEITVPSPDGTKLTLVPTEKTNPITHERVTYWGDGKGGTTSIRGVEFDKETGSLTIKEEVGDTTKSLTYNKDGTEEHRDAAGAITKEVEKNGTVKTYTSFDADGNPSGRTVKEHGSGLERMQTYNEAKHSWSDAGYKFTDKNRHVETLTKNEDGSWKLTRGETSIDFPRGSKVSIEADGDRKITRPDGSSYEGKADGTTITRDRSGHITETVNKDGTTTSFAYDRAGKPTEITVKNEAGKVTEHTKLEGTVWKSDFKDPNGEAATVKNVTVNKDGSYAVGLENGNKVERAVDGTENLKDARGVEIKTLDDKLIDKFKDAKLPLTEAEEKTLRADLASIAKLPPAEREKVIASVEKIMTAGTDATTKLSPEDRSKIVTSLAHHIANPESIRQGGKDACVMANTEQTMAKTHPDVYADMVAKLATEGKYTAANGRTVEAQKDKDGKLAGVTDPLKMRTLTSELFQNAAATLALPEGVEYRSYVPNSPESRHSGGRLPDGTYPSTDGGDRKLYVSNRDSNSGESLVATNKFEVYGTKFEVQAYTTFDGFASKDRVAMLNALVPNDRYEARAITSADQLVAAYNDNGGPPLNIGFNTKPENNTFATMEKGEAGAITTENHAVNITHIDFDADGKPVRVYYDNTAGGVDHSYPKGTGVPINDFVNAVYQGGQRAVIRKGGH